jgi:hypothetical protein
MADSSKIMTRKREYKKQIKSQIKKQVKGM